MDYFDSLAGPDQSLQRSVKLRFGFAVQEKTVIKC